MSEWKYFLVELTYLIPAEQMTEIAVEHRNFLKAGYERGWLLLSGPQVPPKGGIVIGRAPSLEALQEYFSGDPYQVQKVATYRFVEFDPVRRQAFLEDWMNQ